jgi:general secretion pathway protein K
MKRDHHPRQSGAALLMALMLVALITTLATGMVWQQWRAIEAEGIARHRAQADAILTGALDWVRLILREDRRTGAVDHLGEPWATPLAEARLSSFLAADGGDSDEGANAFLSGGITDAQSRYNLRQLLDANGKPDPQEQLVLQRLCRLAGQPQAAAVIWNGLMAAWGANTAAQPGDTPLPPRNIEELDRLGLKPSELRALRQVMDLLPERSPVNVNTAPAEVLAAALNIDPVLAQRLVLSRNSQPFQKLDDLRPALGGAPGAASVNLDSQKVDVGSRFFWVEGRIRIDQRVRLTRGLVRRGGGNGLDVQLIDRRDQGALDLGDG